MAKQDLKEAAEILKKAREAQQFTIVEIRPKVKIKEDEPKKTPPIGVIIVILLMLYFFFRT